MGGATQSFILLLIEYSWDLQLLHLINDRCFTYIYLIRVIFVIVLHTQTRLTMMYNYVCVFS